MLQACEAQFLCPQPQTNRADLESMLAEDFFEVGASGRRHDRRHALEVLQQRLDDPDHGAWSTSDVACLQLETSTWLLTYTLDQRERVTRRATLWRRTSHGWEVLYHQGTLVKEGT